MRLVFLDCYPEARRQFEPLTLCRPIWELRCGITSLADKLIAQVAPKDVACFVPPYMAHVVREQTDWPVNDPSVLASGDLLLVNPRVKADELKAFGKAGPSEIACDDSGDVLLARVNAADAAGLNGDSIGAFLDAAKASLRPADRRLATWNYIWELVLANPEQLTQDFAAAGKSGILSDKVEQPCSIRGSRGEVYIAPGVSIHPQVVIDAEHGPVYIDEEAEIHPFSRIEGPCYIGKKSILLGAKCREGNSIGPVCRIGGEVEESIIHGHSNKYHDGFIGHAYVGEWVNLGALTTNSDLKNDYSSVSVVLDGGKPIDTGSTKVGSLIGDHTKTSIGTLLNTGSCVGAMSLLMATGKPLPKFIPSFSWFLEGVVTKGFGKRKLYETARIAMSRRGHEWTEAQERMWDEIFSITAQARNEAVKKGRRAMKR